jgi:hypothetical protein
MWATERTGATGVAVSVRVDTWDAAGDGIEHVLCDPDIR